MKIEKHNAHGSQLLVRLSAQEAAQLIGKLAEALRGTTETGINHYCEFPCQFEDDNDRWISTDFDVLVENPACSPYSDCVKV